MKILGSTLSTLMNISYYRDWEEKKCLNPLIIIIIIIIIIVITMILLLIIITSLYWVLNRYKLKS